MELGAPAVVRAALTMQWSVDRPGAPDDCLPADQPHGWVEPLEQGPKKSENSCDLVG